MLAAVVLPANDEFFDAARRGDLAQVKAALDKGVPVEATWRYGQTALFIAAGRGHVDVVKLLLERGAKPEVKDTFYGMTALQMAAGKGSVEVMRMLLDKGATGADEILAGAAQQGKADVVSMLLTRGSLKPESMTRALTAAEVAGHTAIVEKLKAAGAKPREVFVVDPAVLASYTGTYSGQGGDVRVELRDGKLFANAMGDRLELAAIDAKTFEILKYPNMKLTFASDGIELTQGGKNAGKWTRAQENAK